MLFFFEEKKARWKVVLFHLPLNCFGRKSAAFRLDCLKERDKFQGIQQDYFINNYFTLDCYQTLKNASKSFYTNAWLVASVDLTRCSWDFVQEKKIDCTGCETREQLLCTTVMTTTFWVCSNWNNDNKNEKKTAWTGWGFIACLQYFNFRMIKNWIIQLIYSLKKKNVC